PADPSGTSGYSEASGSSQLPPHPPPTRWKPLSEEDKPTTPKPAWSIPSSNLAILMNNWASALASTYAPPPENSILA
ncbi:hypothetical protein Tco_0310674, partial [Tanacetum coccineum]